MARHPHRRRRHRSRLEACWPWFLRFSGVAVAGWELLAEHVTHPSVLTFAAGLIGVPEVYHWERNRRSNGDDA